MQLWDIGGQQLGSKLLAKYIYGSDCVILTYDITNYASFKNLQEWFQMVQLVFPESRPLICLVSNKSMFRMTDCIFVHEKRSILID